MQCAPLPCLLCIAYLTPAPWLPSLWQVTIGGVPCTVTFVSTFSLQCIPGGAGGRIYAEYWYLTNSYAFPDVFSYTNPGRTLILMRQCSR